MFDIGFFELLVIAIVGLVVIGPERLPGTVRAIALWLGRIKRGIRDTRQEIEQQIGADEIRRQLHNEEVMQRLEKAEQQLQDSLSISNDATQLSDAAIDTEAPALEASYAEENNTGTNETQGELKP